MITIESVEIIFQTLQKEVVDNFRFESHKASEFLLPNAGDFWCAMRTGVWYEVTKRAMRIDSLYQRYEITLFVKEVTS